MSSDGPKVTDILGIGAVAKAVDRVVEGAGTFLGKICLPAAEEYGLCLKDKVSAYRTQNAEAIAIKASQKIPAEIIDSVSAHPKLVMKALTDGSWVDDGEIQDMWAGLLASSCSTTPDESNLIFMNILSQLTPTQVAIVRYS